MSKHLHLYSSRRQFRGEPSLLCLILGLNVPGCLAGASAQLRYGLLYFGVSPKSHLHGWKQFSRVPLVVPPHGLSINTSK